MTEFKKIPLRREKEYLESFLWAAVISIFLVNIILIGTSAYWEKSYSYGIERDLDMLSVFEKAQEKADLGAIVLGTSRLRHALNVGFYPESPVSLPNDEKAALLQFGIDAGSFNSYAHLYDRIFEIEPDYVFIERHLLLKNSREGGEMERSTIMIMNSLKNYIQRVWINGETLEQGWKMDRRGYFTDCIEDFTRKSLRQDIRVRRARDVYDIQGEEPEAMRGFIAELLARGVHVVIFSFPAYNDVLLEHGYKAHALDVGSLDSKPGKEALLPDNYRNVSWLEYLTPDKEDLYCDYTHYNKKGRKLSTEWFLRKLTSLDRSP